MAGEEVRMSALGLQRRVDELRAELEKTKKELQRVVEEAEDEVEARDLGLTISKEFAAPPDKKGYLFHWQDRSIGWGGTKWQLLFVALEQGRISLYESHMDESPINSQNLRGCMVNDDGWKLNRRYKKRKDEEPTIDTPGAFFHVFSISYRPEDEDDSTSGKGHDRKLYEASVSLPLLRFSTTSLADKNMWMELLSQTCAYCETEEFTANEARRAVEKMKREDERARMELELPEATRGTLPPLYFAPAVPRRQKMQRRRSSGTQRLTRSESYKSIPPDHDAEKREAQYPPSKPMHLKAAPSFLSSEAPLQNYRGLFNLAIILLIVSNFRLIVDNFRLHGLALFKLRSYLDRLSRHYAEDPWHDFPLVSGFLLLQGFIMAAYLIEWFLSRKKLSESVGMALHNVNMHSTLLVSISIVWYQIDNPAVGAVLLFHGAITWMKLISYVYANEDYRLSDAHSIEASLALLSNLEHEDEDILYPKNITLANLYYFWLAPTLTYQIAFPKTPRVRIRRVLGILAGLVTCFTLFTFIVAQIVSPTLRNLVLDLEKTDGRYTLSIIADYWLKLAIANTYLWLLMFYAYFHLYLNLWAELLRFGDRVFYKDWWNSCEIASYWRLWNMPVHLWLVRHLYFPSIRMNMSKSAAMFTVFTVSAILHEVLVSVPFHIIRPWSFLGMMMQIPLVAITKYLYRKNPGSSVGNIIFWLTFCVVGQPMAILMYTADYQFARYHAELQIRSQM